MTTKLEKEFDVQDYLQNEKTDSDTFYRACREEDPDDGSLVRRALSEIAKAHGLTFVTRQTDLNQPSATSDAFANERDHI